MKYQFMFLLLTVISFHSFSMNFEKFDQKLEKLRKKNSNADTKINSMKEHANVLLQLSKQKLSEKKINHLAQALQNLGVKYPVTRSIKVNNGNWPSVIMTLSVADRKQHDQGLNNIINIIKANKGFPASAVDLIEKYQKFCLTVIFPKDVPIHKPYDELQADLSLKNHSFCLYPLESNIPEKHIFFEKFSKDNFYIFIFKQKNYHFDYERGLQIKYCHKNGNDCNHIRIKHNIFKIGDFNKLPEIDQEAFNMWPEMSQ